MKVIIVFTQLLNVNEKSVYHGTKADLLKRFEKVAPPVLIIIAALLLELRSIHFML